MSLFKRLSATLVSRLDQVVSGIEDHDAVVQAYVKDLARRVTEARLCLGRLQRERAQLGRQYQSRQRDARRWRERAVEVARRDEDKALQCLSRAHHCEEQAARLREALSRYEEAEARLGRDLAGVEARLHEAKQRRSLMRARQSTGEARRAAHGDEVDAVAVLDRTFERWEVRLGTDERVLGDDPARDALEREFLDQEDRNALRSELAQLIHSKEKTHDHGN